MSPLLVVGFLVTVTTISLADVKHVLDNNATPSEINNLSVTKYWWMEQNSPLKAAHDYFKKCQLKGNCLPPVNVVQESSPLPPCVHNQQHSQQPQQPQLPHQQSQQQVEIRLRPEDLNGNPFLNGAVIKTNVQYNSGSATIDLSKNPFFSHGDTLIAANGEQIGKKDGFLGVQPVQPTFPKPFSTVHPLDSKKPFSTQHPLDRYENEKDKQTEDRGEKCQGAGYICVAKEQCTNGVVNTNGEGLIQVRSSVHYCKPNQVCCHHKKSGITLPEIDVNGISAGKSSVPESLIKFLDTAGFSSGTIQVLPNPNVFSAGETGSQHFGSTTTKPARATNDITASANSISPTIDYSNTNFGDVRFASTIQGPAYLPPIGSPTPPTKPVDLDVPHPTPSIATYRPSIPTTPQPRPQYQPQPQPQPQPSPQPSYPSSTVAPTTEYLPPSPSSNTYNQYVQPSTPRPNPFIPAQNHPQTPANTYNKGKSCTTLPCPTGAQQSPSPTPGYQSPSITPSVSSPGSRPCTTFPCPSEPGPQKPSQAIPSSPYPGSKPSQQKPTVSTPGYHYPTPSPQQPSSGVTPVQSQTQGNAPCTKFPCSTSPGSQRPSSPEYQYPQPTPSSQTPSPGVIPVQPQLHGSTTCTTFPCPSGSVPQKPSYQPSQPSVPSGSGSRPYQPQKPSPGVVPVQPQLPGSTTCTTFPCPSGSVPQKPSYQPSQPSVPSGSGSRPYQPQKPSTGVIPVQPQLPGSTTCTTFPCPSGSVPQKPSYQPSQPSVPSGSGSRPYQPQKPSSEVESQYKPSQPTPAPGYNYPRPTPSFNGQRPSPGSQTHAQSPSEPVRQPTVPTSPSLPSYQSPSSYKPSQPSHPSTPFQSGLPARPTSPAPSPQHSVPSYVSPQQNQPLSPYQPDAPSRPSLPTPSVQPSVPSYKPPQSTPFNTNTPAGPSQPSISGGYQYPKPSSPTCTTFPCPSSSPATPQGPSLSSNTPYQPQSPSEAPSRPALPSYQPQKPLQPYQPSTSGGYQQPKPSSPTCTKFPCPFPSPTVPQGPSSSSNSPYQPQSPSGSPSRPSLPSYQSQKPLQPYQPSTSGGYQQPKPSSTTCTTFPCPSPSPTGPQGPSLSPNTPYQPQSPSGSPSRPSLPSYQSQKPLQPYQPSTSGGYQQPKPSSSTCTTFPCPSPSPTGPQGPSLSPNTPYQPQYPSGAPSRPSLPSYQSQKPSPSPYPNAQSKPSQSYSPSPAPLPPSGGYSPAYQPSRPTTPASYRPVEYTKQYVPPSQPSSPSPYQPSTYKPQSTTIRPRPSQPSSPTSLSSNIYLPPAPSTNGYHYSTPTPPFSYPSLNPDGSNNNGQYVFPPSSPKPTTTTRKPHKVPSGYPSDYTPDNSVNRQDYAKIPSNRDEVVVSACAAALKCVQREYCGADGVISSTPIVQKDYQTAVPTISCIDRENGINGVCCRDSNYQDPWPSANLVNGVDDGQYAEDDSLGQYRESRSIITARGQRLSRASVGGPRQDFSSSRQEIIQKNNDENNCGQRHYDGNPKGDGPLDVKFAEIPWQAMILRDSNRSLLCGGAIIRSNAVLTAAHCVEGLETKDILVKGGEWKLGIDEEPLPFQINKVSAVIRHPQYKKNQYQNDLAILVLEERFRLTKNVGTICLPSTNQISTTNCIATGWGKRILQLHARGALMHSIPVSVMDNEQCQEALTTNFPQSAHNHSPNTLCGFSNIDQCKVDYGSALACTNDGNQYTLSGIFSWDTGCRQKGQIGGYIAPDVEWIQHTLEQPLKELKKIDRQYFTS